MKETYLKPEIASEVLEPSTLFVVGSSGGGSGDPPNPIGETFFMASCCEVVPKLVEGCYPPWP